MQLVHEKLNVLKSKTAVVLKFSKMQYLHSDSSYRTEIWPNKARADSEPNEHMKILTFDDFKKGCIAALSPLAAATGFVRPWPF